MRRQIRIRSLDGRSAVFRNVPRALRTMEAPYSRGNFGKTVNVRGEAAGVSLFCASSVQCVTEI
jgi:hypothetical protein